MSNSSKTSFKEINRLAVPAIISGIAEPLLSITDTAIVGNISHNATEALAAVGIAGSFISALIWILAQTRSAISATIAKYLGAKKLSEITTLPAQIITINLALSSVIYIVTLFFVTEIFQMYNAEGLVLDYTVDYYKIRALGYPLTLFVFSSFGIFRGLQNTFIPMLISIVGAGLNVGLDFLLVFGFKDIVPAMGVKGAAWASVISQAVMCVMALYFIIKKTPFSLRFTFPFNKEIKNLLLLSMNLIIRAIALNIALYFANSYATKYGDNYIAAQTIIFQIWLFFAFFIDGYASVGNIVSGKLLGEKNYLKLWNLMLQLSKYAIFISVVLVAICVLFYKPLGLLFTKDDEVLQLFYSVFWIALAMQPINALAFVFDGLFKGLSEGATLRNLLILATFGGFLPTILIADYFGLKLYGIWIAFTVWMILRSVILIVKFRAKYLHKNS